MKGYILYKGHYIYYILHLLSPLLSSLAKTLVFLELLSLWEGEKSRAESLLSGKECFSKFFCKKNLALASVRGVGPLEL